MILMSEQELYRVQVLEQVVHGTLRPSRAARQLKVSPRQLRRLLRRYTAQGASGLVHQLRGRASNRKLDAGLAQQVQQLIGLHYRDFGPTLACETLAERHGIVLSIETVRGLNASERNALHQCALRTDLCRQEALPDRDPC